MQLVSYDTIKPDESIGTNHVILACWEKNVPQNKSEKCSKNAKNKNLKKSEKLRKISERSLKKI